jgi:hypothetical protein
MNSAANHKVDLLTLVRNRRICCFLVARHSSVCCVVSGIGTFRCAMHGAETHRAGLTNATKLIA